MTALGRAVLGLAAAYNVAFGVWAVTAPRGFFTAFALDPPRYPAIWATLGMVIGLYGLLYAYAAWRPAAARPIVAVGLAGKVLGPAGWLLAVAGGELPERTFALIAFDDLIWWLPFGLILLGGTSAGRGIRRSAPFACAAANGAAAVALATVLAPGAALRPGAVEAAYVAGHLLSWRAGWLLWIAAAITLVAFFWWWAARLGRSRLVVVALALATAGLCLDVTAESLLVGWAPERYLETAPLALRLSGAGANGLYSLAGALLTLRTLRTQRTIGLPAWLASWTWLIWLAGAALVPAALAGNDAASEVATAALMALFVPWLVVFGRRIG